VGLIVLGLQATTVSLRMLSLGLLRYVFESTATSSQAGPRRACRSFTGRGERLADAERSWTVGEGGLGQQRCGDIGAVCRRSTAQSRTGSSASKSTLKGGRSKIVQEDTRDIRAASAVKQESFRADLQGFGQVMAMAGARTAPRLLIDFVVA
jgi:hypothetical protein